MPVMRTACVQFIFQSADGVSNGQVFQISPKNLQAGVYVIGLYNTVCSEAPITYSLMTAMPLHTIHFIKTETWIYSY